MSRRSPARWVAVPRPPRVESRPVDGCHETGRSSHTDQPRREVRNKVRRFIHDRAVRDVATSRSRARATRARARRATRETRPFSTRADSQRRSRNRRATAKREEGLETNERTTRRREERRTTARARAVVRRSSRRRVVRSFVSRPSSLFAVARRFRDRLCESARVENGRVSRVARRARARVARARDRDVATSRTARSCMKRRTLLRTSRRGWSVCDDRPVS